MLLYPVCACTKQVYLHLHLLHCHLHITMCHLLWTLCEHYCVNIHLPIVSLNAIVPCMSMHIASLSTSTSTTLPLAYHHMSPYVNNMLTLLCEHPSTNCFFKCTVPCMCMYKASLSTYTSTTLPLAYHHVSPYVNIVWTCIYQLLLETDCNMYVQGQCKCLYLYMQYTVTCIWTCPTCVNVCTSM